MEQKNPHIEKFIRKMIEKKGEKLEPDARERLVESLHRLFENMLGRNLLAALPPEVQSAFVAKYDKGSQDIDPEEIFRVFGQYDFDQAAIMKKTLKDFSDLYFRNR
jgi:hypothetical protein